jgi:hypothetical protein
MIGAGEAARSPLAATGAKCRGQLEAAVADVGLVTVRTPGDPTDPSAPAALALGPVRAPRADWPLLVVAARDGFHDAAPNAGFGEFTSSAAGANPCQS